MDRLFLDTNVLLDHLAARSPFDQDAKELIRRAENGQIELCASALFTALFQFLRPVSTWLQIYKLANPHPRTIIFLPPSHTCHH